MSFAALAFAGATLIAALASGATAQIGCGNPDNLCTGDPCIIPSLTVASPCVVDFGSRDVLIMGKLTPFDAGNLSFTAETIRVLGTIVSMNSLGFSGSIELSASGDVTIERGKIKAAVIDLRAGNNVLIDGALKTRDERFVFGAYGGSVYAQAAGTVTVTKPIKAKGGFSHSSLTGGTISLRGADGVNAHRVMDASGYIAGVVDIESSGGPVRILAPVKVRGDGGTIDVAAAAFIEIDTTMFLDRGVLLGGSLLLASPGIALAGKVKASAIDGGSVVATGESITLSAMLLLNGGDEGGSVDLEASDSIVMQTGATIKASGNSTGRGVVRFRGGSVAIEPGATIASNTPENDDTFNQAGSIRIEATSGDCTLAGSFEATGGGGTIESRATGDLTAGGDFRAAPDGCIALSAGGTLDTTGASFDGSVVADCPGSPSGAFLDLTRP